MEMLKLGDSGDSVKKLQQLLQVSVDGQFGPKTELALKAFQLHEGLTGDGVCGPLTWEKLGIVFPDGDAITIPSYKQIKMIDVYHGDGVIDWMKVNDAGINKAYIKATEGTSVIDPMFGTNWNQAKAAGLQVGAYHFFHPNQDPKAQALSFMRVMGPLAKDDLDPVLDWETHGKGELDSAAFWLKTVEFDTGRRPIIYSCASYFDELGNPDWLSSYELWVADYKSSPHIPKPWVKYLYWQFSESASIPGVKGHCDASY